MTRIQSDTANPKYVFFDQIEYVLACTLNMSRANLEHCNSAAHGTAVNSYVVGSTLKRALTFRAAIIFANDQGSPFDSRSRFNRSASAYLKQVCFERNSENCVSANSVNGFD